jgi:hypothetical protein
MESLQLARATHQVLKLGFEVFENIGRELEQYNDRQKRIDGDS